MKLIVYGSDLCPDCLEARRLLHEAGICFEYRSITADLAALMEFLIIRDDPDHDALFSPVREWGGIGIPCFLIPGVEVTLDVQRVIKLSQL